MKWILFLLSLPLGIGALFLIGRALTIGALRLLGIQRHSAEATRFIESKRFLPVRWLTLASALFIWIEGARLAGIDWPQDHISVAAAFLWALSLSALALLGDWLVQCVGPD